MGPTQLRGDDREQPTRRSVHLPVHPTAVAKARREVARAATAAGMGRDRVDDLVVAVSEACTNALEAQLRAAVTDPIEVTFRTDGDVFEVVVRDRGAGFRLDAIPRRPPRADPRHLDVERGWGIQLMRALVNELHYQFTDDGTALILRSCLRSRA